MKLALTILASTLLSQPVLAGMNMPLQCEGTIGSDTRLVVHGSYDDSSYRATDYVSVRQITSQGEVVHYFEPNQVRIRMSHNFSLEAYNSGGNLAIGIPSEKLSGNSSLIANIPSVSINFNSFWAKCSY